MDGTHGQYQGAPGVTKLSLINHTEMWPRAISFSAFLYSLSKSFNTTGGLQ